MEPLSSKSSRPTVGLALRGASTRSVFYIGFLEALTAEQIPIDYIAAMSSSAIVSAAYACGTLQQLKEESLQWNAGFLYNIIERSQTNRGMYSMDKAEERMRDFTRHLKFEDVKPPMGFVTVDINSGEEVVLSMGDIAHAMRATCSLPGIFEPVQWGGKSLMDGGLINMIPGDVARGAGMDIVVGVDLRTTKFIFGPVQIAIRRVIKWLRGMLLLNQADRFGKWIESYFEENEIYSFLFKNGDDSTPEELPHMFSILGKSMDIAREAQRKHKHEKNFGCDILIQPEIPKPPLWKRFLKLKLIDFSNSKALYDLGLKTGKEYAPVIREAMARKQSN